jgi:hypothetical protein
MLITTCQNAPLELQVRPVFLRFVGQSDMGIRRRIHSINFRPARDARHNEDEVGHIDHGTYRGASMDKIASYDTVAT